MKITEFGELLNAVRLLGGSQEVARLAKELLTGRADIEPGEMVAGEAGIYRVTESGQLTRVLVNIVDINMSGKYFPDPLIDVVERREFDDVALVTKAHKYHLLKCKVIERAERQGWVDKYKMSQRRDGRFYYRFIENNAVKVESGDQKLYVCGVCLNQLKALDIVSHGIEKSEFNPKMFFDHDRCNQLISLKKNGQYAEQSVPNKYAADWRLIADRFKRQRNYRCEGENCPNRDLNRNELRMYLHAHHVDMDKTHNDFSNLRALCIHCHAEQPGHEHMKSGGDYKNYSRILQESASRSPSAMSSPSSRQAFDLGA